MAKKSPTEERIVVELLSSLLAQRTDPGYGHVILSETEYESELREQLKPMLSGEPIQEVALRELRNAVVHGQIKLSNQNVLLESLVVRYKPNVRHSIHDEFETIVGEVRRSPRRLAEAAARSVVEAFVDKLTSRPDLLEKLDGEEAVHLGRRAAEQVLASSRWSVIVGDRIDTTQATSLLGVSRQALAKRQQSGSLLGIPGEGTTWYPTWQFDATEGKIRPVVRDLLGPFRDQLRDPDPLLIASWATTRQDEDLEGATPAQWVTDGRDTDRVRRAAERAAARLSH